MFRKISNVIIALFLVCSIGILAVVGIPLLMGNQLYAVLTASMEPTYPVGSIVVVKQVTPEEIKEQDVITFNLPAFDHVVTHRVLQVDSEERQFYTKGDNNPAADPFPVSFDDLEGRVEYGIPYLGHVVSNMRTPGGILVILWIVLAVVLLLFLPDLFSKKKTEEEQPEGEEKSEKKTKTKKRKPSKQEEMRKRRDALYKKSKSSNEWPADEKKPEIEIYDEDEVDGDTNWREMEDEKPVKRDEESSNSGSSGTKEVDSAGKFIYRAKK